MLINRKNATSTEYPQTNPHLVLRDTKGNFVKRTTKNRTKMLASAQKRGSQASGIDTDTLGKKINPLSQQRGPDKSMRPDLKNGVSKEFPIFSKNPHQHTHPSTEIIFGEPEKRVRPMTSKVNSMIRKSLVLRNSRGASEKQKREQQPKYTNSFGQFAKRSLSPDKQKIYSFMYGSTSSLKKFRKRMSKVFLKSAKQARREVRNPSFAIEINNSTLMQSSLADMNESQYNTVKHSETGKHLGRNVSIKRAHQNLYLLNSKVHPKSLKGESQYSSQPISMREVQFHSQNPSLEKYSKPIPSKTGEVFSLESETLNSLHENTSDVSKKIANSLLKTKRRMEKSLKKHYNMFQKNIFYEKPEAPSKDQNLITNNLMSDAPSKLSIGDPEKSSSKYKKKRNIITASESNRQRLKSAHPNRRVYHTSSGNRKLALRRSLDKKESQFSPSQLTNDPQVQLEKILQYKFANEVIAREPNNEGKSTPRVKPKAKKTKGQKIRKNRNIYRGIDKDLLKFYSNTGYTRHFKMKDFHNTIIQ
ncbi:unnamed protein product [Moneuplotes crassus]|uniref:Uncharacterized protein n=1 Tax=Euplotes crassus TaxID=5936 RepID=A0AAD1U1X4_EUPCR|nr:unnamed protein product [Moneuplotes crassus]